MNLNQRVTSSAALEALMDATGTPSAARFYHRQTWIGHLARLDGLTVDEFKVAAASMDEATRGAAFGHGIAALHMELSDLARLAIRIADECPDFVGFGPVRRRRVACKYLGVGDE